MILAGSKFSRISFSLWERFLDKFIIMILAINTSTLQFALALMQTDGSIRAEYLSANGKGHFGELMPALDFLLKTSELDIIDLNGLIVAVGPGSFTGLRVGLSAAKGICHGLNIPIIGVSSLESLASQALFPDLSINPILDSRKGEFFAAQFVWNRERKLIRRMEDICLKAEDLSSLSSEHSIFIGNSYARQATLLKKIIGPQVLLTPPHFWNLSASAVGFVGLKRFLARDFDNPETLKPLYLRPPDIRPNPISTLSATITPEG
jgi:tRNA threonylcarbamoyladenosine biosynthesis protein TsaB